jgi:hypothetical protein
MIAMFRLLFVVLGVLGLVVLLFVVIVDFNDINPEKIFLIGIFDMLFFYLAYRTYPEEVKAERRA